MLVIIPVNGCSPVAFEQVYEHDDKWEKTVGCDPCPVERRIKCCGGCKLVVKDTGECRLHDRGQDKPLYCVIIPTPNKCKPGCTLEFICVRGSRSGLTRRVRDRGNVFIDPSGKEVVAEVIEDGRRSPSI